VEALNFALFQLINAPANASPLMLSTARILAGQVVWLVPASLILGWLKGNETKRKLLLEAALSGVVALMVAQLLGMVWPHPRPFVIGLGQQYLAHVADASFPSDHLTLIWSVAFSMMMRQQTRLIGILLGILGIPVAWSRIYLGVHFPMDMVGAALIGVASAWLALLAHSRAIPALYAWTIRPYRHLFAPLIRRGWFRE
jgi:undecaprenyl-diphosphatase